jgi:DnaD/phage-associated family protein
MEQILFTTDIPNEFIDRHMPEANPVYSVIYIYGYRQYSKGATEISCEDMAETFDITIKDVEKAWKYWEKAGLVEILSQNDGVVTLAFLDMRAARDKPKSSSAAREKAALRSFPEYSLEDVELHLKDKEVQRLFHVVHILTGKPLTDAERQMYLGFYDDLGLPVNVIAVLLEYCIDNNKRHNNYLRTVAHDWSERGISTPEEAEEYISLFKNEYREILRYFGVSSRDPIEKEIEYMHRWLKEELWTMPVIKLACEKTVMNKGRASFAYADGIFRKWKKDNIHTVEQIEALEKTYYDNVKTTRRKAATKSGGKTRAKFQNYQGRKWDYEKLAQMEKEYLDRKIAE